MSQPKLHIHTDCEFFSGSENMIANLVNSNQFRREFELTLSYRETSAYSLGLMKRFKLPIPLYPLKLFRFRADRKLKIKESKFHSIYNIVWHSIEIIPISLSNIIRLYILLLRIRPRILHINNGGFPGALSCRMAVVAGKMARVKTITMVVNNMAIDYSHPFRWFDFASDRFISKNVELFITGSKVAVDRLQKVLKFSSSKGINIPNGVEIRNKPEGKEKTSQRLGVSGFDGTVFGFVGIMLPRKGHLFLFRIVRSMVEMYPREWESIMILVEGEGNNFATLRKYVSENSLDRYIKFIGSESNIFNLLSIIDVLVYPAAEDEDFPNIISEAMALSKPVISTKVAGAVEQIVNLETGLLIDIDSEFDFGFAMMSLAQNRRIREKMGLMGRKRFEDQFTIEHSVLCYVRHYKRLINESFE